MTERDIPSAEQAMREAIHIEDRNARIYESLASMFESYDAGVRAVFLEMAAEERSHGAVLRERFRECSPAAPRPAAGETDPAAVVEAPELPDSEVFVFDTMDRRAALEVGFRAETDSRDFYRQLIAVTDDERLRRTYEEPSEFEDSHIRALNEKLAAMGKPPAGSERKV